MTVTSRAWIAFVLLACGPACAQSNSVTITLTGQSMIRSDLRATAPDAVPRIRSLLTGDVVFTNFEGAIAEPGQSVTGGGADSSHRRKRSTRSRRSGSTCCPCRTIMLSI